MTLTTQLSDTGPLPTTIRFVNPMNVINRKGAVVGRVEMEKSVSVPAGGGSVDMSVSLKFANDSQLKAFSDFSTQLIQSTGSVYFALEGDGVCVQAAGLAVSGLRLYKEVFVKGSVSGPCHLTSTRSYLSVSI